MFQKNKILILIGLLSFTIFFSCDQPEISENITLTVDFIIDDDSTTFDNTVLLNAFDESHVLRDYGNHITGIEIRNMVYYMTFFTGPGGQQINTGSFEVAGHDGSGAALIGAISNENLQNLLYQQKELNLQQEGISRLEELIQNNPHEFRLRLSGKSNLVPNDYTLTLEIELRMFALPL